MPGSWHADERSARTTSPRAARKNRMAVMSGAVQLALVAARRKGHGARRLALLALRSVGCAPVLLPAARRLATSLIATATGLARSFERAVVLPRPRVAVARTANDEPVLRVDEPAHGTAAGGTNRDGLSGDGLFDFKISVTGEAFVLVGGHRGCASKHHPRQHAKPRISPRVPRESLRPSPRPRIPW